MFSLFLPFFSVFYRFSIIKGITVVIESTLWRWRLYAKQSNFQTNWVSADFVREPLPFVSKARSHARGSLFSSRTVSFPRFSRVGAQSCRTFRYSSSRRTMPGLLNPGLTICHPLETMVSRTIIVDDYRERGSRETQQLPLPLSSRKMSKNPPETMFFANVWSYLV